MTSVHDYGHGICAIDAHYRRPGLAAFYLLVEGDRAAFIDTGTTRSVPNALEALRDKGLAPEQVAYVIPTHVHLDHAGGAGEMMRVFPRAKLVAHPRGARHLIDPAKLIAGVTGVYGADVVARDFDGIVPVDAARAIEAPDGFALDLNGRTLRFLDTPGHARHHFCVWDERSRGIFTGDTFGLSYRELDTDRGPFVFPTTTPVQFEPEALHASIDRLRRLHPEHLYLAHFGRIAAVERAAAQMHELIDAFVAMAREIDAAPDSRGDAREGGGTTSGTKEVGGVGNKPPRATAAPDVPVSRGTRASCTSPGAVAGTAVEDRHAKLIQGQRDLLRPRLRVHGCRLGEPEIDALLALDYELNAQGIGIWLDRTTDAA